MIDVIEFPIRTTGAVDCSREGEMENNIYRRVGRVKQLNNQYTSDYV